jgi:hypothetical protein
VTDLALSSHATLLRSLSPTLDDLPRVLALLPHALPPAETLEPLLTLDAALTAIWQELTAETVGAYLEALRPVTRTMSRLPPFQRHTAQEPGPIPVRRVGPWECFAYLGRGGSGQALAAEHAETGQLATVKLMAGADPLVAEWFAGTLPPQFLAIYEWGVLSTEYGDQPWVAREPAAETLADYFTRRQGARLPLDDLLTIFRTACDGVAALHAQRVYQWSAHARNVFRIGARWKLGDLGRCDLLTTANDPKFANWFHLDAACSAANRAALLNLLPSESEALARKGGLCAYDPFVAHRLIQDDLAMLGGFLVDLLAANRWQVFARALATECQGCYDLTGQRSRDAALSGILNRCWLGDGGGALALAFGQEATWEPFEDAGELFEAVASVMGVS